MTDLVNQEASDRGAELVTQNQPDESSNKPASPKLPTKTKRQKKERDLYSELPVLRTESKADFARLRAEITRDIDPKDSIAKIFASDIVYYTWDIIRYRRVATGILNNALGAALVRILRRIQFPPSRLPFFLIPIEIMMAAENLGYQWLFDPEIKRHVSSLLQEAGFDESAIEAEAYRRVADDLEKVDRKLNAARAGRDKSIRSVAKYHKGLSDQLRRNSDRVIAADEGRKSRGCSI